MNGSIISYAEITSEWFITPEGRRAHPGTDIFDIPRESVYPEPYRPFGKMGSTEKLLFSTVSLAIGSRNLPESTGIILVTPEGSLAMDKAYMNSVRENFPRPALFAATLPSSPIAEIAIPFGLKGPNRVFADTNQDQTLLNGLMLLKRDEVSDIICCHVNQEKGKAAAVILGDSYPPIAQLSFSPASTKGSNSDNLFSEFIESINGKTNFSSTMIHGTLNMKVEM